MRSELVVKLLLGCKLGTIVKSLRLTIDIDISEIQC